MADTSAPLSEVAIANMAATALDERFITSLDQGTTLATFVASQFGYVRDEMLRVYPWAFAKKRAALAADPVAPEFGYRYQYRLPADCLRLLPVRTGGRVDGAPVEYELESGFILTNEPAPLRVRYIRRVVVPTEFDALFARAMGMKLALLAAHRVTGKASYMDRVSGMLAQAMSDAFLVDSQESGTVGTVNNGMDNVLATHESGSGFTDVLGYYGN